MLANSFSTATCFASFELIKFMCFGSTLISPHEEFLIPRPPRTRSKFNPRPPRSKFNPHPPHKCWYPQPARVNPPRAGLWYIYIQMTFLR